MKTIIKYILIIAILATWARNGYAQAPSVVPSQPLTNLFDANPSTNWVSSFNGDSFPIDLEVEFGSTETVTAVMLKQIASSATDLADCKVNSFAIFLKPSDVDVYPETPVYEGSADVNNTGNQWFALPPDVSGASMLLRIYSVTGNESTTAALSELGIRAQRKNGNIASSTYDKDMPGTWAGITWTANEPRQVAAIDWHGKTLMSGYFNTASYALLEDNYDFTNTNISVSTGFPALIMDESVKIAPTLVDSYFSVTASSKIERIFAVSTAGIKIMLDSSTGNVSTANLNPGLYIIVVETDKGKSIQKIIKR